MKKLIDWIFSGEILPYIILVIIALFIILSWYNIKI